VEAPLIVPYATQNVDDTLENTATTTWFQVFFPMARQPLGGLGRLIIEASRSHSDTPHSVGLLWTSDQPDAETST
jgi:hypothetical protein